MLTLLRASLILSFSFILGLQALAQDTLDKALLWQIDAPGASTPSYLFGTIHLIDAESFLISDSLMSALNRSDRVMFEIDPSLMTDVGTQMGLMMKAFMLGDTTLSDLLTPEEYKKVQSHFNEIGLPLMFLERIKPLFLSMIAGMDGADLSGMMGGPADESSEAAMKSYELELDEIAREADKIVGGLETIDYQMSLFDSIPYTVQAQMLMNAIDAPEGAASDLEEITKIYTTGDIEGMYEMSIGGDGGFAGFERLLLVNRNRNWIAPILKHSAEGTTLFAVGAGHLGGPEGVIRLLMEQGVKVTPLSVR